MPSAEALGSINRISNPPPLIADPAGSHPPPPQVLPAADPRFISLTQASGGEAQVLSYKGIQSSAGLLINPGPGLPAISKKVYETICAGGYIDFAQLPAAKGRCK